MGGDFVHISPISACQHCFVTVGLGAAQPFAVEVVDRWNSRSSDGCYGCGLSHGFKDWNPTWTLQLHSTMGLGPVSHLHDESCRHFRGAGNPDWWYFFLVFWRGSFFLGLPKRMVKFFFCIFWGSSISEGERDFKNKHPRFFFVCESFTILLFWQIYTVYTLCMSFGVPSLEISLRIFRNAALAASLHARDCWWHLGSRWFSPNWIQGEDSQGKKLLPNCIIFMHSCWLYWCVILAVS